MTVTHRAARVGAASARRRIWLLGGAAALLASTACEPEVTPTDGVDLDAAQVDRALPSNEIAYDHFPMPPSHAFYNHWWKYTWQDGQHGACPQGTETDTLMYTSANGDDLSGADLLTVNFVKDASCGYWGPGRSEALRWYSEGWLPSQGSRFTEDGVQYTPEVASFRGWSRWSLNPNIHTHAWDGPPSHFGTPDQTILNGFGAYVPHSGVTQQYVEGGDTTTRLQAEARIPSYPVVFDHRLEVDLTVSNFGPEWTSLLEPDGTPFGDATPSSLNANPPITHGGCPAAATEMDLDATTIGCDTMVSEGIWKLYTRNPPAAKFAGKDLYYVAIAEGGCATHDVDTRECTQEGDFICEEWWFADGIGPVGMVSYPVQSRVQCEAQFLMSDPMFAFVTDPEAYYESTKMHLLIGMQWLDDWCVDSSCFITKSSVEAPPAF